jgi:hypothetical protein
MKPKLETKEVLKQDSISAAVTTTCKLTIKGQTFDLSLEELEHIHNIIGQALGKKGPERDMEAYKKAIEIMKKARPECPAPHWPSQPYVPPILMPEPRPYRGPNRPPYEVWCSVGETPADKVTFGGS